MNPTACRVCRQILSLYTDLVSGQMTWRHPAAAGRVDHDPQPVPADTVTAEYRCDFCSDPRVIHIYRTRTVDAHFIADDHHQVHHYGTDWAACIACSKLVEARNADALTTRCQQAIGSLTADARDALHQLQRTIVDSLQPGRAITAAGAWPPAAVPAPTLPKIRDRLVALLSGPDRMENCAPHARAQIAETLPGAHLYWVDPDFTDLTRHAMAALPDTPPHPADLPTPHGLVAWATPLHTLTALTWTSTRDGLLTTGFRAVGHGLHGPDLQHLREQVGWLVPTWCSHTPVDHPVARAEPARALVATLLLVAQQLADTTTTPVDDRIRKAYRRQRREEPVVRLIRLRTSKSTYRPGGGGATGDGITRDYRWWVRGHWRQQPYGPGRTQRRLIYINPQLRGPKDRPIKATTTVRVIGSQKK